MYSFDCLLWYVVFFLFFRFNHVFCLFVFISNTLLFSALFVPSEGSDGCGGGGWEWKTLHTVAATLLAFCVVMVVLSLLGEHFFFYRKRKAAIKSKTKRKTARPESSYYDQQRSRAGSRARSTSTLGKKK